MTSSMNKKQLSCLVAGLCCTTALIAFCIWAGIGGFFERFSHPAEKLNRSEKNVSSNRVYVIIISLFMQLFRCSGDGAGDVNQR